MQGAAVLGRDRLGKEKLGVDVEAALLGAGGLDIVSEEAEADLVDD
jgi:hypothetical protein